MSAHVDPDGAPFWMYQRARRLAREGLSVASIATLLGTTGDQVVRLLKRRPRFNRCPTCGGQVILPCRLCQLRGAVV